MLVGKKVVLRTVREADLDKLYDLAADVRDMGEHWPVDLPSELRWKKNVEETAWWEENRGGLLMTDREDNILGQIAFFKASPYQNAYELGYRIYKPENWGKGYTTEAVSLAVSYLFETKPVGRIQATALPGNTGSQRVLEKCGFQFEGVLRKAIFFRGENQDLHIYSILRDESEPLRDKLA